VDKEWIFIFLIFVLGLQWFSSWKQHQIKGKE